MGRIFDMTGSGKGIGLGRGHKHPADTAVVSVTTSVASIAGEPGDVVSFTAAALNASGVLIDSKTYSAVSSDPTKVRVDSVVGRQINCTILTTTAGTNVTVTCDAVNAPPVTFTATWVVASVTLNPASASGNVGVSLHFTATALNRNGLAVPGQTFTATSSAPSIASVGAITGSDIAVTLLAAGTASIRGAVGAITSAPSSVTATVSTPTPAPASYSVQATTYSPTAGAPDTLSALAFDKNGNRLAIAGVTVAWAIKSGSSTDGSLSSGTSVTDASGIAQTTLSAGAAGSSYVISVIDSGGAQGQSTPITVAGGAGGGSIDPDLPQTLLATAVSNTPSTSGTTRHATDAASFQAALDAALPGDVITLAAGVVFSGNFTFTKQGTNAGWITIKTDGGLPPEGTRVTPTDVAFYNFPRIVSPNTVQALTAAPGATPACYYRVMGVEIAVDPSQTFSQGIVRIGENSTSQTSLAQVPHHFYFDRCYTHGNVSLDCRKAFSFDGASCALIDSYVSEIHSTADAQCVTGTNGPGPYKIVNNYLESSGENIAWGGADPRIANLVPSDIEVRRNHITKQIGWLGTTPWNIKNLYESKNSRRAWIRGNVLENCWASGQTGNAFVLWSVNQDETAPWCITEHQTVEYNTIRNTSQGFQLSATIGGAQASLAMNHVLIRHNAVFGMDNPTVAVGTARLYTIQGIIPQLQIIHNTGFSPDTTFVWNLAGQLPDHIIRDNLTGGGSFQIFTSAGSGSVAWSLVAGAGSSFDHNVVALAPDWLNPIPGNFYPATLDAIGLAGGGSAAYSVTATIADLALAASSPYKGQASDSTDPGVDSATLTAEIAGVV